jgi:hypothetical protein
MTSGSCLCGSVVYELDLPLTSYEGECNHCHCKQCRLWTGALVFTAKSVPVDALRFVSGEKRSHFNDPPTAFKTYESSPGVKRGFCSNCGSSMMWYSETLPDQVDICLGTVKQLEDAGLVIDSQWYCENIIPGWEIGPSNAKLYMSSKYDD